METERSTHCRNRCQYSTLPVRHRWILPGPRSLMHIKIVTNFPPMLQTSLPLLLKVVHSAAYWCVRSRICCGRGVACMMLRILTPPSSSMSFRIAWSKSGENCKSSQCPETYRILEIESLTSEYHLNCHATSLIRAPTIPLGSPCRSYSPSSPLIAFGLNRMPKQDCQASTASAL